MTDTPELKTWTFEVCTVGKIESAEYAKGYQAAIDDVVKWLRNGDAFAMTDLDIANEISERFGKGQDHG